MITAFIFFFLILLLIYGWLIERYRKNWNAIPDFTVEKRIPITSITVVIAARNEEANLPALLESLERQQYPTALFDVIIVDDHSTDQSLNLLKAYQGKLRLQVLQNDQPKGSAYKKRAIEKAVDIAKGSLIATTDADCLLPPSWLNSIASFYENNNYRCIAGPVRFFPPRGFLQIFQSLDFITLQGITGAAISTQLHYLGNGANFIYERESFFEVGGFEGIDHLASGDDMLLMQKIALKYPGSIGYLKDQRAIVLTAAMNSWKSFFNQRIRWASKTGSYRDKNSFRILLLVYLLNLSFLILVLICFADPFLFFLLLLFLLAKLLIEFPFVSSVAGFFGYRSIMKWFALMQPVHIGYTIIAGFFGRFGSYQWKGRRINT